MNESKLSHEIAHAIYEAKGGAYVKVEPQQAGQNLFTMSAIDAELFMLCFEQAEGIISKSK